MLHKYNHTDSWLSPEISSASLTSSLAVSFEEMVQSPKVRKSNSGNKKTRIGNLRGKKLGRVGKPETQVFFSWPDQFETGVVKRATLIHNLFGSNVAEQLVRLCCSYYHALRVYHFQQLYGCY